MKEIFNKSILEQLYELRKEDFEQEVYDKNKKIQDIEMTGCKLNEEILSIIKKLCKDKKTLPLLEEKIQEYSYNLFDQIAYWSKTYYLLGAKDMIKLKKELMTDNTPIKKGITFLEYNESELKYYVESKVNHNSKCYKNVKEIYKKIENCYPKVFNVMEFDKYVSLNEKEVKQLMDFYKACYELHVEEIKASFKAGIEEILNL